MFKCKEPLAIEIQALRNQNVKLVDRLNKTEKVRDYWNNVADDKRRHIKELQKELSCFQDYSCKRVVDNVDKQIDQSNKVAELELSLSEVCNQRSELEAQLLALRKEAHKLKEENAAFKKDTNLTDMHNILKEILEIAQKTTGHFTLNKNRHL